MRGQSCGHAFSSVHGFLALLKSVQQLSIKGWEGQLLVRAEAINALDGLQKLALKDVTIEGDLTGPCLSEIVCASLQTQLLTVLARPPPALASILVPHVLDAVVPKLSLALMYPGAPQLCARALGRLLGRSRMSPAASNSHRHVHGLVRAVPCRD